MVIPHSLLTKVTAIANDASSDNLPARDHNPVVMHTVSYRFG